MIIQKNVTAVLQKQAGDLPLITLASGNDNGSFGADPALGVAKKLTVESIINGKLGVASFDENALVILPMPKSHVCSQPPQIQTPELVHCLGFGQFRCLCRKSKVAWPLMLCPPWKKSMATRSDIPN